MMRTVLPTKKRKRIPHMHRTKTSPLNGSTNLADVLRRLGGVSPTRIRAFPAPGTAREADVTAIHDRENRLFELVDGVLVEKAMGYTESCLAMDLGSLLHLFAQKHDLGFAAGSDATTKLMPGLVRIPDVSFVSWSRLPSRIYPTEPIPQLIPSLAVEVLSASNTKREMERKLQEYFLVGVLLVWFVDPKKRIVTVYTAPDQGIVLSETDVLDGGTVLPGFQLPLSQLFARVSRDLGDRKTKKRGKGLQK